MHFKAVLARSVDRERLAPSIISGGITDSSFESPDLTGGFRFIGYLHYVRSHAVATTGEYYAHRDQSVVRIRKSVLYCALAFR